VDIHVYWNMLKMHGPMNVKSPNNASKWQMGFNSAFKELNVQYNRRYYISLGTFGLISYSTDHYNTRAYWIVPSCYCILYRPLPQPFEGFTLFSYSLRVTSQLYRCGEVTSRYVNYIRRSSSVC
jgi:hypothetical protein